MWRWTTLIVAPLMFLCLSLLVGRIYIPPADVVHILLSRFSPGDHSWSQSAETIVMQIRLPRVVMAAFVGAGLAGSGAAYQGMFRNPLVSPDILGVTAAAAFGAALALLLSFNALGLQLASFGFGLLGVGATYLLAKVYRSTPLLLLVLSGVVVAAFFSALLSATKYIADPDAKLPAITYWLLGSLNGVSSGSLSLALPPIILGVCGLLLSRWHLNVLAMGDAEARSLGVNTQWSQGMVIASTTLITAAAVSVCGIVGWVGLVVPHFGRMLVGPDHRLLLPVSLSIGASYLLLIDDIARSATAGEIPLGILTALIGAPVFAYLLHKTRGIWQ